MLDMEEKGEMLLGNTSWIQIKQVQKYNSELTKMNCYFSRWPKGGVWIGEPI